ncbi:tetratricopeptide repeat protein [Kibdelosporangium philippinense]|uniref:Tetratricopeptide repeat protein n=1 Tax=Kibdelosporangium philippinense TaxID=211113 RepID=A0ABS8Z751_9PSEU|nr:BTAD domain-containing putative transcriptional regulator [Kibdelosporangium philippinense]MCE7002889.1 tetratricopeptide repeat protein [Kibdelosporangium philippinense]
MDSERGVMGPETDIQVLGPWEIRRDGEVVAIPPGQLRVLLAALVVSANHPVTTDTLAERLWPDEQPGNARGSLHTYVGRLRQLLGRNVIERVSAGRYQLGVKSDRVDVYRFRELLRQSRAQVDSKQELALLCEALRLWRGRPFSDVASSWVDRDVVPRLTEEWFAATERRIDIEMDVRQPESIIAELHELTDQYPTRESLWVRLISALHRAGRREDALVAYAQVFRILSDEFGIDPGAELQRLRREILQGNRMTLPWSPAPRQLPHDIAKFTGRQEELTKLDALLTNLDGAPIIVSIDGAPGMGKTALALHWAHRVADKYSDVQLYLNLRGYGPGEPIRPNAATEALLRELGVPGEAIPSDVDERSALLRSKLSDRRPLILLDNARDAGQVRPLLPGSSALVIVTSRNQLRGLSVRDGAHRVTLNPMAHRQAIDLLSSAIGPHRVAEEPTAAARLVKLCDYLPLALAIVAERAHRTDSLADVVLALEDEKARLDNLGSGDGDPHTDLRAALSWSYRALRKSAALMFRKLGLLPANDIGLDTAAALSGLPRGQAKDALDQLIATNLLEQPQPGRYQMHDLIRLYATNLVMTYELQAEREEAVERVLDWYLHAAVAADKVMVPHRNRDFVAPYKARIPPPVFVDAQEAAAWFNEEYESLRSVTAWAVANGWDGHAWRIALALTTLFDSVVPWREGLRFFQSALDSARAAGERVGEAYLLNSVGCIHLDKEEYHRAKSYFERSLARFRELDIDRGLGMTLGNLSITHAKLGDGESARDYAKTALKLSEDLDYPRGITQNLDNLGIGLTMSGDYAGAVECHLQAHERFQRTGDVTIEAFNQHNLGLAYARLGNVPQAIRAFHTSISLHRTTANRRWEAATMVDLGVALNDAGHSRIARGVLKSAMGIMSELADPRATDIEARLATMV